MARSEPADKETIRRQINEQQLPDRQQPELTRMVEGLLNLVSQWADEYRRVTGEEEALPDGVSLAELRRTILPTLRETKVRPTTIAFGDMARKAYDDRRLRERIFDDPELFAEPAWDILLDLASAEAAGERLAVTSVYIGSCVPATTAHRWIAVLEERGLVQREHDILDARRTFVRLTKLAAQKMERYFVELSRSREDGILFFPPPR
jgi:hypothetical protein